MANHSDTEHLSEFQPTPLESSVLNLMTEAGLLSTDPILVALSGGGDSVALLAVLKTLQARHRFPLEAVHINHHLRGEESNRDQQFVVELCRKLEVPLTVESVRDLPEANREEIARLERYRRFGDLAFRLGASVATGHTMEDQAETFLLHLFRGAAAAGLSGIALAQDFQATPEQAPFRLVRPLLQTRKADLRTYLAGRNLQYREDRSNRDLRYDRNWVRHRLIPSLEERLNPRVVETLARNSEILSDLESFVSAGAERAFKDLVSREDRTLLLSVTGLLEYPRTLRREIYRRALAQAAGALSGFSRKHIEEIDALLHRTSGASIDLPGPLRVMKSYDRIAFLTGPRVESFSYRMTPPGEVEIVEIGRKIRLSLEPDPSAKDTIRVPAGEAITIRNRREGERVRISGKDRRLKDALQDDRIPRWKRDRLLILESRGKIVWVDGLPGVVEAVEKRENGSWITLKIETFPTLETSK